MDAHRVQGDLHRDLRAVQLGHAGLHVAALTAVVLLRRVARQLPRGGELGGHLRQVVADGLVLPDRLAEALALLRVGERILERGGRDTQGAGGDLQTTGLESLHHVGEALAGLAAEDRVGGDAVVVETQFARLDALVTQLGQVARDRQARAVLDEHHRDALVARLRGGIGLAQQRDQPRATRVGDPRLGTVDDQLVAVALGGRRHRLQVGAAAGLGQRHRRADLTGGQPGQVLALLLLGAEQGQQLGDDGVPAHRTRQRHPSAGEFLGDLDVAGHRHRRSAVLFRHGEPVDADLLHLLDPLLGVLVGVLDLLHRRLDLPIDEVADGLDQKSLFVVQVGHGGTLRRGRATRTRETLYGHFVDQVRALSTRRHSFDVVIAEF